ncbi:MAG TPA: MoxR family ATPase [Polyangiaceae bacterium]|nr:MoxR family ATPase [Polyangiaceae bacterium]
MVSLRVPAGAPEAAPGFIRTHSELLTEIRTAVSRVIRGKPEAIELLLLALLAGGHALVEDVPGVGKTTLAKALARVFRVGFSRVQFTPDLLPADILGSLVLDPAQGSFSFHRGPIFTNVLLADEINRASPRTQSALLEAMSEAQVTVDGITYPLSPPFFVFATQNPHEFAGTYPLPEAQLDRFLVRIGIGYPTEDEELSMLYARQREDPLDRLTPVASADDLTAIQTAVHNVEVKPAVARYLLSIVTATRDHKDVVLGASPRGTLSLFRAAQARAFLNGRAYVSPDDAQALAGPVLGHRITLTPEARYGGRGAAGVLRDVVQSLRVPI